MKELISKQTKRCHILCRLILTLVVAANVQAYEAKEITMVVWRGCEDACQGFVDYFSENERTVDITIVDVARDKSQFDSLIVQLNQDKPDLVLTWGTTVSKSILGTYDNATPEQYLSGIPAVFMIVADPIGAKIVESVEHTGRPYVTGTLNRVSNEVQLKVIEDYLGARRLGMIYNEAELNSVLNYQSVVQSANDMGMTIKAIGLPEDVKGSARDALLIESVKALADANVDAIYVGSSSYLVSKSDLLTETALEYGIGVVTGYEQMVRQSSALLAIANHYYNVGKLAGLQADKILFEGQAAGDLPVRSLARSSLFINMETAKKLQLYPPIQLLRFAEIVNSL